MSVVLRLLRIAAGGAQGRSYLCRRLDLVSRVAVVRPADLKYYTKTRDFCDVHVTGGRAAFAHNVRRHPFLRHCLPSGRQHFICSRYFLSC